MVGLSHQNKLQWLWPSYSHFALCCIFEASHRCNITVCIGFMRRSDEPINQSTWCSCELVLSQRHTSWASGPGILARHPGSATHEPFWPSQDTGPGHPACVLLTRERKALHCKAFVADNRAVSSCVARPECPGSGGHCSTQNFILIYILMKLNSASSREIWFVCKPIH